MTTLAAPVIKQRISSIDIVRGLIMVIMTLDHTRDFFIHQGLGNPTNMATTTPIYFFTRWITHFCAPTFVFLSGVSAYLAGTRRSPGQLSAFLLKRGLWLMLSEMVLMSFVLTLDVKFNLIFLIVLWAIGFSMVLLALLSRASLKVVGIIGVIILFGHNILDFLPLPKAGAGNFLMTMFFTAAGSAFSLGNGRVLIDAYAVIPWTGVMLLGYVFGVMFTPSFDPGRRRRILRLSGLALICLFISLRFLNIYGDPSPWSFQRTPLMSVVSFFNATKSPPSLLYLSMTLGPILVLLSLVESVKNRFNDILIVYGNVPFFYYFVHLYLIRLLNIAVFFATGHTTGQISTPNQSIFQPADYGFSLGGVYLMWLFIVILLYLPCRWYSNYKRTHSQWWLSYL